MPCRFNHMELSLPKGALTAQRAEIARFYCDLEAGDITVHAFYLEFRLPIWFDVQVIE